MTVWVRGVEWAGLVPSFARIIIRASEGQVTLVQLRLALRSSGGKLERRTGGISSAVEYLPSKEKTSVRVRHPALSNTKEGKPALEPFCFHVGKQSASGGR